MKFTNLQVIQLISFLNKRDLKDFPDLQTFNKVQSALKQLQTDLSDYYTQCVNLEEAYTLLLQPYIKEADDTRKKIEDEEQLKLELASVQKKADADKKLVAAFTKLNEFKTANDSVITEVEIKDPNQKSAVKQLFEKEALNFPAWVNKDVIFALSTYLGV